MKFRSLFYDSRINLSAITKSHLVVSVLLGIASALIIYSFFFVLVETFRIIATELDGEPEIISESNRNYYNTFFAALSVVFGNSITLNFLFSRPQKVTHRYNSKRKRLLNDNIFLSFNFSYWFTKLGLVFGIFSMCCLEFEFLPYFKEFSFLLIVVLYLESLKNFSYFLRNKDRLKFIIIHILFLTGLTFGISRINVVDYKSIDKVMVRNNPILDLPFSNFYNDKFENYRDPWIRIKLDVDSLGIPYFYSNNIKYELGETPHFIVNERAYLPEETVPFLTINLEANKETNIYYVKLFEKILANMNHGKASYLVRTEDTLFGKYESRGLKKRIHWAMLEIEDTITNLPPPPPHIFDSWVANKVIDTVFISIGEVVLIDKKVVQNPHLKNVIKQKYSPQTLFLYQYSTKATYQDFISVYSPHLEVLYELRKSKQTIFKKHQYDYSKEYYDEQRKLKEDFPLIIAEEFK